MVAEDGLVVLGTVGSSTRRNASDRTEPNRTEPVGRLGSGGSVWVAEDCHPPKDGRHMERHLELVGPPVCADSMALPGPPIERKRGLNPTQALTV